MIGLGGLTFWLVIGLLSVLYIIFHYSLWELLPWYRRLRLKRLEKALELDVGEPLLAEAELVNRRREPVWLALTARRLLALRQRAPKGRVELLEELVLGEIEGLRERVPPISWPMVLVGTGLGGLGALLSREFGDLWPLLLIFGVLILLAGFVRIRQYELLQGGKPLPYWSFSSQGRGRFRARRFARSLREQLAQGQP